MAKRVFFLSARTYCAHTHQYTPQYLWVVGSEKKVNKKSSLHSRSSCVFNREQTSQRFDRQQSTDLADCLRNRSEPTALDRAVTPAQPIPPHRTPDPRTQTHCNRTRPKITKNIRSPCCILWKYSNMKIFTSIFFLTPSLNPPAALCIPLSY